MSGETTIDGVQYISSKRASEISAYSQDYIGQLARAGKIQGKRVGGLWYVLEGSLTGYKSVADAYSPIPPNEVQNTSADSSLVTFEGKTYVSAARAAKLTSYHQDYIGQLARGGKILSRQVGRRWYVDIGALIQHKKEKDALLGAVQVSSVGLQKGERGHGTVEIEERQIDPYDVGLHYTYKVEAGPLMPTVGDKGSRVEIPESQAVEQEEHLIPIRVVRQTSSNSTNRGPAQLQKRNDPDWIRETPVLSIFIKLFPILAITIVVFLAYNFSPPSLSMSALKVPFNIEKISIPDLDFIESRLETLKREVFSKKIYYSRE